MNLNNIKMRSADFLLTIILGQVIFLISVLFDLPIIRQIVGFIYFTFVPGLIIVKLLRMNELDGIEKILFSVGFSLAFLMIGGLVVNEFAYLVGISEPLSLTPLMIFLNSFIILGGILVHLRGDDTTFFPDKIFGINPVGLVVLVLPILSIVGAFWVNSFNNNIILLFLIVSISIIFIFISIFQKPFSTKFYALIVFAFAISLLFHASLISNYIVPFGSDVPLESFIFKSTQSAGFWNLDNPFFDLTYGRYHSMLSITILPTIYSTLLNIDPTLIFKIVFPLLFSFLPLGLFKLWKGYVGKKYAFLSAFLFMAQSTFYTEMLGLNRQMIAELFFVLLFIVILSQKLKPFNKTLCFLIFSFGLVTSHYGLSVIFLVFILISFIMLFLFKNPSGKLTASMIVLFFVVMFVWYISTSSGSVFNSILEFGEYVSSQLGEFFNPASRGREVLRGLGLESPTTFWNSVSRAFAYATEALIVLGFVGLFNKRLKMPFDKVYFVLSLIAMAFLASLIVVPALASTMNMTRFYHILLFFLSPLCVMGAKLLVSYLPKPNKKLLVCIILLLVLVPYFLFQTNFVYEVTDGDSWSIPLSKDSMEASRLYGTFGYIDVYGVYGSQWLSENIDFERYTLYADVVSINNVLTCYGMIYRGYVQELSNNTILDKNSTLYLSTLNVVYGQIPYSGGIFNTTDLSFNLNELNKIYTNSYNDIYKNLP